MAYRIKLASRAERDLAAIYSWINADSSGSAAKWYLGLREAIRSLREQPNRCPKTPEDGRLRHLLYGEKPYVYRVSYRVLEEQKQVDVLHIRHGIRSSLTHSS